MTSASIPTKKWKLLPYLIGAFLGYVLCIVTMGRRFTAGASWNLGVAAVGAIPFWPFLAVPHLGLQLLLGLVVRRFWNPSASREILILNVPIVVLIVLAGISAWREPERVFRGAIADPIPESVRITQFGRWQGIGEPLSIGMAFQIAEKDLQTILLGGEYAPVIYTNNPDALYPESYWVRGGGIKFDPEVPRQHYRSTKNENWHLLFRTNDPEVFFFYYAKPIQ